MDNRDNRPVRIDWGDAWILVLILLFIANYLGHIAKALKIIAESLK